MHKKIKLPDIIPDLFVSDDVAIVGSSSIILDKKEGQKIDDHKDVIRFNRAITKGFEKHTGNRTTLRVTNGHTYQGFKLPDSWEFCSVNPDYIKHIENNNILYWGPHSQEEVFSQREDRIDPTSELFYYKKYNQMKFENRSFTLGTGLIIFLVSMNIKPHVYGIDVYSDGDHTHYFEKRPAPGQSHNHRVEKTILRDMNSKGLVKFHI